MKRLLFLVHRWGGVALALVMALWFFSGLVIVFAEPPTPTRAQALARAEPLSTRAGWLSAGEAWEASAAARAPAPGPVGAAADLAQARLVRRGGEPLWIVEDTRGRRLALSAVDGAIRATPPERAVEIARRWAPAGAAVSFRETVAAPAMLRSGDGLSPFHRVSVGGGAGEEVLVSAVTGEVVQASSRLQRVLFWAGSGVHLFRPLELLGAASDTRVAALEWLAFLAAVASLTGLVVGWLRWRPGWFGRRTYAGNRTHPYREAWLRWHFWSGLVGGALATAWAVSGYVSNNPWHLFSPAAPGRADLTRYAGGPAPAVVRTWRPGPLPVAEGTDLVELQWARVGDTAVLLGHASDGTRRPLQVAGSSAGFEGNALAAAVGRLAAGTPIAGTHRIEATPPRHSAIADASLPSLDPEGSSRPP